jgi:hypothetical protein
VVEELPIDDVMGAAETTETEGAVENGSAAMTGRLVTADNN